MGKESNMEDFVEEVLFGKKKKKAKPKYEEVDIKKIIEQDEKKDEKEEEAEEEKVEEKPEEEEVNEEEDVVLEVVLSVNEDEEVIQVKKDEYPRRAITDFLSLISLFKDSADIDVKMFLQDIGVGATPEPVDG